MDVGEVQAGGGLIEHVERVAGGGLAQFGGELDALGFAAGERRGGLAEVNVAQADVVEGLEQLDDAREVLEEVQGLLDPSCSRTSAMFLPR